MNHARMVQESLAFWERLAATSTELSFAATEQGLKQATEAREQAKRAIDEALETYFAAATEGTRPYEDALEAWEKQSASFFEHLLKNQLFLDSLGRGLDLSLTLQRAAVESVEAWGRFFGMPRVS